MFKIALSAGHGKNTAGKRCMKKLDPRETREWVLNSRIAEKIEELLSDYSGWELLRLDDRTGARDIPLKTRTKTANAWGADFYLAIHHNAGVYGGKGGGIVAFVYTRPKAESVAWQKALYNALIEETGLRGNRATPMAKKNLHECREPDMASTLLELGFMDSKTDVPVILTEKFADQCARVIVNVIVERGKLTKKPKNFQTYLVRVTANTLNVRAGAGTSYDVVTKVKKGDVYTIVAEDGHWGKLKSGAGWISLKYCERV